MVDRPSGPIGPWLTERLGLPPGSLLGTADVAALLGVTRQRVSQLQKEPTFPRAFTGYGSVKFWRGAGIECWAAGHRADGDRVGGRFVGEAAALLLSAEVRARELRVWWVESMTVWLAVASGDAGLGLQSAVLSMGLTAEDIVIHIERWRPSDQRSKRTCRMDPHVQARLAAADRSAAESGRDRVGPVDILVSFIDEPPIDGPRSKTPADHVLASFKRRGLDIGELRDRLVAADGNPTTEFEPRKLRRRRDNEAKGPDWLDLAPNPVGHDPWTCRPWGAAFARTRDGRHLEVDSEHWFFTIDGDGFYVRAADGRPVGYRYRKLTQAPKRNPKPVNGFMEILPMPPVEMDDWPDRRFGTDD
jgi:hypothetical protein